jgi:dihydroorotate dehydrogenase
MSAWRKIMYNWIYKHFLSKMDPEDAHDKALKFLQYSHKNRIGRAIMGSGVPNDRKLSIRVLGKKFRNPLGMAAGFDKHGLVAPALFSLGFSHVEVGTVTVDPRIGNPKPRIWREGNGLRNYMGLPGPGSGAVFNNLIKAKKNGLIGISISPIGGDELMNLYTLMELFHDQVDYFTVNVSCPNCSYTERVEHTLAGVANVKNNPKWGNKPVLLKIGSSNDELYMKKMADLVLEYGLSGIIAVNTMPHGTKNGGISGPSLKRYGLKTVKTIFKHTDGKLPIIGVGGIYNYVDVLNYIKCGASLVQLYTSFVYEGLRLPTRILNGLLQDSIDSDWNSIKEIRGVWV